MRRLENTFFCKRIIEVHFFSNKPLYLELPESFYNQNITLLDSMYLLTHNVCFSLKHF